MTARRRAILAASITVVLAGPVAWIWASLGFTAVKLLALVFVAPFAVVWTIYAIATSSVRQHADQYARAVAEREARKPSKVGAR